MNYNMNYKLVELISNSDIQKGVSYIANKLNDFLDENYKDEWYFITIMKEGIPFSVDLAKQIRHNLVFDYIFLEKVYEYNNIKELAIKKDVFLPVNNKNVIVCATVIYTGYEVNFIKEALKIRGAKSIFIVSLILKESSNTIIKPDFYYFNIKGDDFLVGYGLAYNEKYRNLNSIYKLVFL
ncbi:MAG: phosphoribosyltransferase [bacterium]